MEQESLNLIQSEDDFDEKLEALKGVLTGHRHSFDDEKTAYDKRAPELTASLTLSISTNPKPCQKGLECPLVRQGKCPRTHGTCPAGVSCIKLYRRDCGLYHPLRHFELTDPKNYDFNAVAPVPKLDADVDPSFECKYDENCTYFAHFEPEAFALGQFRQVYRGHYCYKALKFGKKVGQCCVVKKMKPQFSGSPKKSSLYLQSDPIATQSDKTPSKPSLHFISCATTIATSARVSKDSKVRVQQSSPTTCDLARDSLQVSDNFNYIQKPRYSINTSSVRTNEQSLFGYSHCSAASTKLQLQDDKIHVHMYSRHLWDVDLKAYKAAKTLANAWNKQNVDEEESLHIKVLEPIVGMQNNDGLFDAKCATKNGEFLMTEDYLDGKFVKWNSNSGWFNQDRHEDADQMIQAFCHWTFHKTDCKILLCDAQGVLNGREFVLTDPCILSRKVDQYGKSDVGPKYMLKWFENHECNDYCGKRWQTAIGKCAGDIIPQRQTTYSITELERDLNPQVDVGLLSELNLLELS